MAQSIREMIQDEIEIHHPPLENDEGYGLAHQGASPLQEQIENLVIGELESSGLKYQLNNEPVVGADAATIQGIIRKIVSQTVEAHG